MSSTRERAEELRRRVTGRPLILTIVLLLILTAVVVLVAIVSPVFHARDIRVRGNEHLHRKELLRLAEIGPGTNVLFLNEGAVEGRLLSNPWIRTAAVTTSLPSEIAISLAERSPVGVVERPGAYVLVAGDGTLLGDEASRAGLPTIVPGPGDGQDLRAPAAVLSPMSRELREMIDEVGLDAQGMVVLRLASGVRVIYGPPTEAAAKAEALGALLEWSRTEHAELEYVDVRFPSAPTARLRDDGSISTQG